MLKYGCFAVIVLMISCTDAKEKAKIVEQDDDVKCYRYTKDKDTINLKIRLDGDSITGSLVYNLHEKDSNKGTVVGRKSGDFIIADYTFMSEGVSSVRQVAFKKEDDAYVEGFGDVSVDNENKTATFKNLDSLTYTNGLKLKEVNCDE